MMHIKKCSLLILLFSFSNFFAFCQIRRTIPLVNDWLFCKGDVELKDINTIKWEKVAIPHTWNKGDGLGGTTRTYYRGPGTYVRTFELPSTLIKSRRIFLRFEAVSSAASVYINGSYLGKHEGAFNAFCYDITPYLKKGKNELVVRATNAWNENIAPLAGDFTIWGGIYRPVSLIVTDPVCISPLDYASSGVYVTQTDVNDERAILDINSKVINTTSKDATVQVCIDILDAKKVSVGSIQKEVVISKGSTVNVGQRLIVSEPILWNGRLNPYLYQVQVEVRKQGHLLDRITEQIGIRYYEIDSIKGFFLNGKSYRIRGVNRHQDRENKGWAINNKDHEEDMSLIEEIGANGIRLAHYAQSNYFYSLCDKNGMLVWTEIPFIERASYSKAFLENIKLQLTEMIRQNYNHPSIFCWGLFNELSNDDPLEIVKELNDLSHKEDRTRFTVCAPNQENRKGNDVTDYIAYNTYPGWYWADPEAMSGSLNHWFNLTGHRGIAVSEYGAGASIFQHEQGRTQAPKTDGPWHPEEWQSIVHEENYKYIKKDNFVWGSFVWNMFDFGVASRNEGDKPGINDKGLVTYDRKVKKDAFFFYKANWSDEPVLYITSRRSVQRNMRTTDVKVYSNASKVRLKVNRKDIGTMLGENGVFIWKNIPLRNGRNAIVVSGKKGKKDLSDKCDWVVDDNLKMVR